MEDSIYFRNSARWEYETHQLPLWTRIQIAWRLLRGQSIVLRIGKITVNVVDDDDGGNDAD